MKKKIGRPTTNIYGFDGDRLSKAIDNRGYTKNEFGQIITSRKGKSANDWVYQICHGMKVSIFTRDLITEELDLPYEYLSGEKTLAEIQQEKTYSDARTESEKLTVLIPLLEKAGFEMRIVGLAEDGSPVPVFYGRDNQHIAIHATDLKKMESMCADLCASMLRNMGFDAGLLS